MRELITAFIIVFTLQLITNKPALPEVKAQELKHIQAAKHSVNKKVVKHATKKRKAQPVAPRAVAAPTPAPAVARSAPVVATNDGSAKSFIYSHESGGRTDAVNPSSGACGLGQALPCSKMPCSLSDYACQDAFFTSYMLNRYGSWENARQFWLLNNWW